MAEVMISRPRKTLKTSPEDKEAAGMQQLNESEIVAHHHDHFKQTRDIQWKINISLWSLLTAGIFTGLDKNPKLNPGVVVVVGFVIMFFHLIAAYLQEKSMKYDKVRWKIYFPTKEELAATSSSRGSSPEYHGQIGVSGIDESLSFFDCLWIGLQVGVTFVLVLVLYSALTGQFRG
jgi:hypothetical protein